MKRMENKELINCSGGGLFSVVTNLISSLISLVKAICSLKNLRG